jgi:hypothetical protein
MVMEAQGEIVSIGTSRAKRSGLGADWSPRDACVEMLRLIDAGLQIDNLIICYDGVGGAGFQNATKKFNDALSLLVVTQWELTCAGRE